MGYTPTIWKDHILSDNLYNIKQNGDGTVSITSAGSVVQQGTPMSAEKFNNMEQGIKEASDKLDNLNREQFAISNTTSTKYQYVKIGKVSTSKSGSRAMIQLVGKSSYNDIEAGGKVEIYLSCNDLINTGNCRIGAMVYAYGNSTANLTVTNTWATEVLVVRAEGYSTAEADIYLKFTSGISFTSYFAVMEKQDTFKWTTDVEFTNTDPTENATYSYTAAKKLFRNDYLSANEPLKTSASGKLLCNSTSLSTSTATIEIPNLFTNYCAVICNAVTTNGKYSITLPLAYIKSLGTSNFYEAEGLLFYYANDSTLTVKTGLGQSYYKQC